MAPSSVTQEDEMRRAARAILDYIGLHDLTISVESRWCSITQDDFVLTFKLTVSVNQVDEAPTNMARVLNEQILEKIRNSRFIYDVLSAAEDNTLGSTG